MRTFCLMAVLTCLMLGTVLVGEAVGKKGGGKGGGGGGGGGTQQPPPPVDQTAVRQAQAALDQARSDLTKAQTEATQANNTLAAEVARLRKQFEATPDMVAALNDFNAVAAAYTAAKQAALATLAGEPDYQAALAAKRAAVAREAAVLCDAPTTAPAPTVAVMDSPTTAPVPDGAAKAVPPTAPSRAEVIVAALAATTVVDRMQAAALDADRNCQKAKGVCDAAAAKLSALRTQFEQSLPAQPTYATPKAAVDAAKAKVQTAQAALDAALKAYNKVVAVN